LEVPVDHRGATERAAAALQAWLRRRAAWGGKGPFLPPSSLQSGRRIDEPREFAVHPRERLRPPLPRRATAAPSLTPVPPKGRRAPPE